MEPLTRPPLALALGLLVSGCYSDLSATYTDLAATSPAGTGLATLTITGGAADHPRLDFRFEQADVRIACAGLGTREGPRGVETLDVTLACHDERCPDDATATVEATFAQTIHGFELRGWVLGEPACAEARTPAVTAMRLDRP